MSTKNVRKFSELPAGGRFRIHSEPSRGIKPWQVKDHTVYEKESEAGSRALQGQERYIILYPEDEVRVVTLPKFHNPNALSR